MKAIAIVLALVGVVVARPVTWGGDHVEMEVTDGGARLEFDCARGTIDEPVRADSTGMFRLKGTFTPERGGPSRDDAPSAAKASYSGTIKDDTMALRIVIDGQGGEGSTFELVRNRPGNVRKCR